MLIISYISLSYIFHRRGICGEHLYAHFFEDEHIGLGDVSVKIIDVTDVRDPAVREGFWIEKLKCDAPLELNVMEVCNLCKLRKNIEVYKDSTF